MIEGARMSEASIYGTISPIGYLHIMYDMQFVDGRPHSPWDCVYFPKDNIGTVSFTLPQGIIARIQVWSQMNGHIVTEKVATIPNADKVALEDLLK
jgi:hypothetical protein